ncbi:MAG TPA: OmpA family protein, partial [Casimicrobiaceae bacterium]|nr:OmpA family protein [Casimicrobiaceae bacterium]
GNQVSFSGTKPGSGSNGTSPGNGYTDLAIPQDYTTSNWGAEGGYQSSKATLSLRWDYSKFENNNQTLQWTNPFFGSNQLDTTYLPPDNTFNKFTASGNYRDLPWKSVISARYTWAKTTSNVGLGTTALNGPPAVYSPTLPDQGTFNGENVQQSFALAWTAIPATNVDTRVYYYWTKLQNNSDQITYGNAPTNPLPSGVSCGNYTPPGGVPSQIPGNCENDLFDYTKNNAGFDIWWKFMPGNRLGGGYDYNNLNQNRVDYDHATTNSVWLEYKNTQLDTITGRLKWVYLKRDSDHNFTNTGLSPNDPNYMLPYTSAFDMQSNTSNLLKLYLDWVPMQNMGLDFEGVWGKVDYDDVTLGRTSVNRQGYFASGNWTPTQAIKLNAWGSWEQYKYPSDHRYIGTVAGGPTPPSGWCTTANPNCYDPFAPPYQQSPGSTTASYNWSSGTRDQTWMIGIGGDWQAMEQLKFTSSYMYISNKGNATFANQSGIVLNNPPTLNIDNFDNSSQQFFNLKGIWSYNKNWSVTGGYSYMKYTHNDIATNGYQYVLPYPGVATNTSLSYLNGYDAFTDGHSNIFYVLLTYKFDAPSLPVAPLKMAEVPPAPRAAPAPPPPPPPAPAPAAPQVQRITLDSKVLFDFDKHDLKPEGKAAIDSQVVGKLNSMSKLEVVVVTGHTDRIGTVAYNQKLSERRADAVRDYLVSKGVDKSKIETIGMGEKQPVVQCDQKSFKQLVECLAPNRRVEIQAKGDSTK